MKFKSAVSILALASASCLFGQSPADDKPRIGEFLNIKVPIIMIEGGGSRHTNMDVDGVVDVNGVPNMKISYLDGSGGTIMVPMNSSSLNFKFRLTEGLSQMLGAYQSGRYNDVVESGRRIVYPAVALMGIPEERTNIQYLLGIFAEALVKTQRYAEAKALMDALSLSSATPMVGKAAIDYASAMISAGRYEDAASVLNRLNFGGSNVENIPYLMNLVEKLRKDGKIAEASRWYTKLQGTKDNPRADEAALWMAYCDLLRGNVMSSKIFLDRYADMDRKNPIFSLRAMVMGMLLSKTGELSDALDYFAQGIVYGEISADWAAELRYNAGLAYKRQQDFKSSNAIFNEVILLYPTTPYKALAEKELVVIAAAPGDDEEEE